jgi:hypothetical protein
MVAAPERDQFKALRSASFAVSDFPKSIDFFKKAGERRGRSAR